MTSEGTSDIRVNSVQGMKTVDELSKSMQSFGFADYSVFTLMLISCGAIGIYFGFIKKSSGEDEYLVGGRNMKTLPITLSLIASFISGISLLGTPTEIYVHGTSYLFVGLGVVFVGFVMSHIYLPVFHELRLTSTYEYLERRFDKKVRILGSVLFGFGIMLWLPIVIYVPALAFNQVTGINIHIITPFVCIVCIFYTCVGGLKAVVWTDFVQAFVMFGAMLLIIIKGTIDLGGLDVVIRRNRDSGRLDLPLTDWHLSTRHTLWALVIGGFVHWLQIAAINQNMLQRYMALPTLKAARRALWGFIFGALSLVGICGYAGMLIYAWYHDCDPLTTKPFRKTPFTTRMADVLMKLTVVILGAICVALVFVVEKAGSHVLQLSISLSAIHSGPSLGIFSIGVLLPWIDATSALIGGLTGLGFMSWITVSAQSAIASGVMRFEEKPVTTEGCTYWFQQAESMLFLIPPEPAVNGTESEPLGESWALYRLSYLWYTVAGAVVTMSVGIFVSVFTPARIEKLDPMLVAPFLRKYLKNSEATELCQIQIPTQGVNGITTTTAEDPKTVLKALPT